MSNEIEINHQESMRKRDLTRKRKSLKFEILQSFRCIENKVEEFFLKKGKLNLRSTKTEKISHILQINKGHVFVIW